MSELNNHELAILCCKIALDKIFQVCDVSVEHHWHEVYEHIESFENE
jgi:hypothetical protein